MVVSFLVFIFFGSFIVIFNSTIFQFGVGIDARACNKLYALVFEVIPVHYQTVDLILILSHF